MWFLVFLVWLGLVAGIFWAYGRKRRRANREREKELDALIQEAKFNPRTTPNMAPVTASVTVPRPAAITGNTCQRKSRLLGQADALLYLLFRAGLPDHEVFANLTLADVVEPNPALRGYEREQLARKLLQQRLRMVICNKQLEIIAVVRIAAGVQPAEDVFVKSCLQSAGIRLVDIDAAAMPRHQQIRTLVYGEAASGAA